MFELLQLSSCECPQEAQGERRVAPHWLIHSEWVKSNPAQAHLSSFKPCHTLSSPLKRPFKHPSKAQKQEAAHPLLFLLLVADYHHHLLHLACVPGLVRVVQRSCWSPEVQKMVRCSENCCVLCAVC